MQQNRLQREKEYHVNRFGGDNRSREKASKYYSIMESAETCYLDLILKYCRKGTERPPAKAGGFCAGRRGLKVHPLLRPAL